MALTLPSVAIQTYMTFTAVRWGQSPTITFSSGAVAGSEVVTVSGTSINIQVQPGVTTMAQVKTALLAQVSSSGFSANDLATLDRKSVV